MTDIHAHAPVPVGDVVPGDPPVPITVWPVPAPHRGESMSNGLGVRLVHNLTHPADLIIDLTDGPQLARAIINARRRSHLQSPKTKGWGHEPATLIVTGWPAGRVLAQEFFELCRGKLRPGGCVAVLLPHAATDAVIRDGRGQLDIHTDVLVVTRSAGQDGEADD
jgi:hypothetical protein